MFLPQYVSSNYKIHARWLVMRRRMVFSIIIASILMVITPTLVMAGDVYVRGYYRTDGTYVQPHYRSSPDGNILNNWSTKGNVNPYTGKPGTIDPYKLYNPPRIYSPPSNNRQYPFGGTPPRIYSPPSSGVQIPFGGTNPYGSYGTNPYSQ